MALRGFVHGVGAPVGPHRAVAGADDHMARPGRAVHEVPLAERALLTFDDGQRLAGEHEEVLLICLPVVHRHRLAGRENGEVDPELQEIGRVLEACALELAEDAATLAFPPLRLARIEDESALPLRDKSVLGRHELRLRTHRPATAIRGPTSCAKLGEPRHLDQKPNIARRRWRGRAWPGSRTATSSRAFADRAPSSATSSATSASVAAQLLADPVATSPELILKPLLGPFLRVM